MAATKNKKAQDEKYLRILRELLAVDGDNKYCFDCHQRGPTYVNMTVGSFVCTACSGLLRGLNPPHRVKSISMTSFSAEDIEFILSRGNEFCGKVWLGLFDHRSFSANDSKDEVKLRELMLQKYERRRWYLPPTDELYAEAQRRNTAPESRQQAKCMTAIVGPTISLPALKCQQIDDLQLLSKLSLKSTVADVQPVVVRSISEPERRAAAESFSKQTSSVVNGVGDKSTAIDLLGDLDSDVSMTNKSSTLDANFADFSKFDSGTDNMIVESTSNTYQTSFSVSVPTCPVSATAPCVLVSSQPQPLFPLMMQPQPVSSLAQSSAPINDVAHLAPAPYCCNRSNCVSVESAHLAGTTTATMRGTVSGGGGGGEDKYAALSAAVPSSVAKADSVASHSNACGGSNDKYAALAELDGVLGSAGGGGGTAIDWDNRFSRSTSRASSIWDNDGGSVGLGGSNMGGPSMGGGGGNVGGGMGGIGGGGGSRPDNFAGPCNAMPPPSSIGTTPSFIQQQRVGNPFTMTSQAGGGLCGQPVTTGWNQMGQPVLGACGPPVPVGIPYMAYPAQQPQFYVGSPTGAAPWSAPCFPGQPVYGITPGFVVGSAGDASLVMCAPNVGAGPSWGQQPGSMHASHNGNGTQNGFGPSHAAHAKQ